jgi:hypothetical protein
MKSAIRRLVEIGLRARQAWYPEEDEILRQLVKARKSWVLISAKLKRSIKHVRYHQRVLFRRSALPLRSD